MIFQDFLCVKSFLSSLLEHELAQVLCDLWDCSTFHFPVVLYLHTQVMTTQSKTERDFFAYIWNNLCSSILFHILLWKLQHPWPLYILDFVSTERHYWVIFVFFLQGAIWGSGRNHLICFPSLMDHYPVACI